MAAERHSGIGKLCRGERFSKLEIERKTFGIRSFKSGQKYGNLSKEKRVGKILKISKANPLHCDVLVTYLLLLSSSWTSQCDETKWKTQ